MSEISKISLLVIDSLRYDCLTFSQDHKFLHQDNVEKYLDTPTLDSICKNSVSFEKCYSTSSETIQTLSSMFTGTTQANHKIYNNKIPSSLKLNDQISTLSEILQKLGFMTVLGGDMPFYLKHHNVTRGFQYDFSSKDDDLFEFLNKNKNEKIFLFYLFEDVHFPYLFSPNPSDANYNDDYFSTMTSLLQKYNLPIPTVPEDFRHSLYKINNTRQLWFPLYVKGITKFDKGRLNSFLTNLNNYGFSKKNNSLLLITADHGEGKQLFEFPDIFNHGNDAFEESTRVPLIVRLPSYEQKISKNLASNIDVFKIILDICSNNKTEELINHKLYCINPLNEKRIFCWYSIAPSFSKTFQIDNILFARTIITENKKFTLRGRPEIFLNPKIFELEHDEFLQKLYYDLYVTNPSKSEYDSNLNALKSGKSNLDLYNDFIKSDIYKSKHLSFVFDLDDDPFEKQRLYPFDHIELQEEFLKYFEEMLKLEKLDTNLLVDSDKHNDVSDEDKEIELELKKLGYL